MLRSSFRLDVGHNVLATPVAAMKAPFLVTLAAATMLVTFRGISDRSRLRFRRLPLASGEWFVPLPRDLSLRIAEQRKKRCTVHFLEN